MKLLRKDVRKLTTQVALMDSKLGAIHNELMGNGGPGLIKEWTEFKGGLSAFKWVAGGSGVLGLIVLVMQIMSAMGG